MVCPKLVNGLEVRRGMIGITGTVAQGKGAIQKYLLVIRIGGGSGDVVLPR